MGRIIKYNIAKGDDGERTKTVVFGSGSSSGYPTNNDSTSSSKEMSVNLWGNDFHGIEDLNGTIKVTDGDIYITFDPEDFDSEGYEDDDIVPSGSLYADGKIQASEINATANIKAGGNITAGANITGVNVTASTNLKGAVITATSNVTTPTLNADDIYFNYPERNSSKQNLRTVLENLDASGIEELEKRVTNVETKVKENEYVMDELEDDILNHTRRLDDIEERVKFNWEYIEEVDHKRIDLLNTVNLYSQTIANLEDAVDDLYHITASNTNKINEIQDTLLSIQQRLDSL